VIESVRHATYISGVGVGVCVCIRGDILLSSALVSGWAGHRKRDELSEARGSQFPFASSIVAVTKAASEPFAVTWKVVPFGLVSSGTTVSTILFSAPAVVLLSVATTVPDGVQAFRRHRAGNPRHNPGRLEGYQGGGFRLIRFVVRVQGFGVSIAPCCTPLTSSSTDGQLLKAFT
jgi:hypothetical protein